MRLTLSQRLALAIGVPLSALGATIGIAWYGLASLGQELSDMGTQDMPMAVLAAKIDGLLADEVSAFQDARRATYSLRLGDAGAQAAFDEAVQRFERLVPLSGTEFDHLRALTTQAMDDDDPEVVATYRQLGDQIKTIDDAQTAFEDAAREAMKAMRAGDRAQMAALVDAADRRKQTADEAIATQVAAIGRITDDNVAGAAQAKRVKLMLLLAIGLAGVLVSGVIGWRMAHALIRQIGGEPEEAAAAARAIAQGDLTHAMQVKPGDRTSLLASMQAMRDDLRRIVGGVRADSDSVATASSQIAQGNQDLSQRTEEQASALQQTAATMEQLGTTVGHNADSAKQADQLARGASSVVAQGGEVFGRVVSTMQGISDSSRRISDIIGVIDGIAFQTNILALNAAVEAARAGEQGRGFAVVAGEVRSLAQRSAEAAREIKTLIGHSVEQVSQGTALVDAAGKTMQEIVESIQRVSHIVSEITSASAEQSSGIRQVGDAVQEMDRMTQQNAALVEESAAAAESLRGQAQRLVQAVAVFKLAA